MTAQPGRVTRFAEQDYLYGIGDLVMRVERIDWARPTSYDGEDWFEVEGVELTSDGREVGPRQALVRGRRLAPPGRTRRG
jgi:hypothetical protein